MLAGAPPFEAELLRRGERGMRQLVAAGAPPAGYVSRAARRVLEQPRGRCLLLSGFYVRKARAAETDGPPGAAALGKALTAVGFDGARPAPPLANPPLSSLPLPHAADTERAHLTCR